MDVVGAIKERRGEDWRVGVEVVDEETIWYLAGTIGLYFGYI